MRVIFAILAFAAVNIEAHGADIELLATSQQDAVVVSESEYLIKNVRIINGGSEAKEGLDIVVSDGLIKAIGPTGTLATANDIKTVDGGGKTVMPGLVMVHEHLFYPDHGAAVANYISQSLNFASLYLSYGVTTIRTGGSMNITDDIALKKLVEAGKYLGPEINLTAPYVEGPGSFSYQMPIFETDAQVRKFVRYWAGEGVGSLKAYMNIKPDILGAAIDEAHKLNMHVTGHLCSVTYAEAAELGIDNLEHGFLAATDFDEEKETGICPDTSAALDGLKAAAAATELAKPLFQTLIENDVYITSTLPVFAAGLRDYEPSPFAVELMADKASQNAARISRRAQDNTDEWRDRNEAELKTAMKLERAFAQAGGKMVVGTDPTGWGGTIPGPANHSALFLLEEAGFSAMEAIGIATLNGATLLGIEERTGTIAVGMEADMILVNGKPDQNLKDIGNIELVISDGLAIDGKKLAVKSIGMVGR